MNKPGYKRRSQTPAMSITMPTAQHELIKELCEKLGITRSEFMQRAATLYIEHLQK